MALLFYANEMGLPKDEVLPETAVKDHVVISPGTEREVCEFRVEVFGARMGYSGSRRNSGNPNAFKTCMMIKNGDLIPVSRMTVIDLRGRDLPEKTTYYVYVHGVKIMVR